MSNSSDGGSTKHLPPQLAVYVNAAFSSIITAAAVVGNLLVVLIYARCKSLRDVNNTAITVLSLSDLTRACVVITLKIHNQVTFVTSLAEPLCTLTAFVCGFTFVCSPMLLALIGVVRYCVVVPPNIRTCAMAGLRDFRFGHGKFYLAVSGVSGIAVFFAVLPAMGVTGEYAYSPAHGVCFSDWREVNEIFRTLFYLLVIGLAFPVLITFYSMLFLALRRHSKLLRARVRGPGEHTTKEANGNSICGRPRSVTYPDVGKSDRECSVPPKNPEKANFTVAYSFMKKRDKRVGRFHGDDSKQVCCISNPNITGPDESNMAKEEDINFIKKAEEYKRKERGVTARSNISNASVASHETSGHISEHELRVTKLMMIIFVAYCVCWLPAAILNAVAIYHKHGRSQVNTIPPIYFYIIVTMVELKCALNPIIYGLGNQKYQKVLRGWLKYGFCGRRL